MKGIIKERIPALVITLIFVITATALVWGTTYDTATPAGDQVLSSGDDRIREVKAAIQERLDVCVHFPLTGTAVSNADTGKIRELIFTDQNAAQTADGGASPTHTAAANEGILDIKDSAASKRELWWWDEDGNNLQLTSGGSIYLTGEYDQDLNLSNTGNAINTDALTCTSAGTFKLPFDTVTAVEGLVKYNNTADTVMFSNATPAWDTLMSSLTVAFSNAAYGSSVASATGLSVDVGFAPDIVIAWNEDGAAYGDHWMWNSMSTLANKNISTGVTETSNLRISVSTTTITFPYGSSANYPNRSGSTVYYFALDFRAAVQNPSAL